MRDYTSFHRFSYMRYITLRLLEDKDTMWDTINTTANAWARENTHETFHEYVLHQGMNAELPTYEEFLQSEYQKKDIAAKMYAREADMQLWCDEQRIDIPDDYLGM